MEIGTLLLGRLRKLQNMIGCGKYKSLNSKLLTKYRVKIALLLLFSFLVIIYTLSPRQPLRIEEFSHSTFGKSPPVVMEIIGGLGNQMFQYAAAYSIAKKRNSDLYICVNGYDVNLRAFTSSYYSSDQRKYALDQFNVPQDKLIFWYPTATFKWNRFDESQCSIEYYRNGGHVDTYLVTEINVLIGDLPDDTVLLIRDLFESDVFFAADKLDIWNVFEPTFDTHPIEHLIKMIQSTEHSVSIHIRRGDFSRKEDFRLISLRYQREAMQLVKEKLHSSNVTFFVFTDDVDYVKKHLDEGSAEPNNIVYMSDLTKDNALYDFLLMSLCRHNIITNSTFSWWAAYLNKNLDKIVVAPLPKYRPEWIRAHYPSNHSRSLLNELAYPKGWLTIQPKFLHYSDQDAV